MSPTGLVGLCISVDEVVVVGRLCAGGREGHVKEWRRRPRRREYKRGWLIEVVADKGSVGRMRTVSESGVRR